MALHRASELKVCLFTAQYIIQLAAHVNIYICYFVMRLLRVSDL
jgi:hypothetical protein